MSEFRKGILNILTDSAWIIIELAFLLIFAWLIVGLIERGNVSTGIQSGVVAGIVLAGGLVLEFIRRYILVKVAERIQVVFLKPFKLILSRILYPNVLVPDWSKQLADFERFLVTRENQGQVDDLAARVAKRVRADARGKSIRGIAVLPAERERIIYHQVFWYMIADLLDIKDARFEWVEPLDIKVGLLPCIGRLKKSDYVALFRMASLGDELEDEAKDWLAKNTGASVGSVRFVTVAASSKSE